MKFPSHISIPKATLETIWEAITVPKFDDHLVKTKLAETTERPVTIEDLKAAITRAPVTSVPGPSGLSYAMMKEWTPKGLQKAFDCMTMIWETGQIPNWWKRKWLCPKAKVDPSQATLEDLRPLCLIETTRKIWLGIIVGRIVTVWETDKVLAEGQYGFRQGRGCEGPTLQVVNVLEDAEEVSTEIHGSSLDIRRAFDTISKPILLMSWQRLGVPERIAKLIVDMDKDCLTILLTPHAMHILNTKGITALGTDPTTSSTARGFFPATGTSQGDTPSPVNWNASLDVLLRALHAIDPTPFFVRTNDNIHPLDDTAYADDLFSISSRREGLQAKADVVSAFTIIFGLKIAIHKLRTFAKCWGEEPSNHTNTDYELTVHNRYWIPTAIPVTYIAGELDNDSVFKYLGVYIDSNNRYLRQYRATKELICRTCETATFRQASAETITTVMLVSPFRKASFPAKYCPWSKKQLQDLDKPVSALYKHHLNLMSSTSKAALYMTNDTGGMGIRRLSDQILSDKWAMTWRGLHADLCH